MQRNLNISIQFRVYARGEKHEQKRNNDIILNKLPKINITDRSFIFTFSFLRFVHSKNRVNPTSFNYLMRSLTNFGQINIYLNV